MFLLMLGLVVFLGLHSIGILAARWRADIIAAHGDNTYKGVYSLIALAGLVMIVFGYSQTRQNPVFIWNPPMAMNHLAALLVLFAFILLAASKVPGNRIKAAVGHPIILGVKVWAFAHLLANGRLGDMLLFGAFLVWAIADYVVCRRRDRVNGVSYPVAPGIARDAMSVVLGGLGWLIFALWLHLPLIGVSPFAV